MPGPGGPGGHRGGPGRGPGGGPGRGPGGMGHGPGGRGPMGPGGGHMHRPIPPRHGMGPRPYLRGCCSGCLMPVLGTIAVVVLIFAIIF